MRRKIPNHSNVWLQLHLCCTMFSSVFTQVYNQLQVLCRLWNMAVLEMQGFWRLRVGPLSLLFYTSAALLFKSGWPSAVLSPKPHLLGNVAIFLCEKTAYACPQIPHIWFFSGVWFKVCLTTFILPLGKTHKEQCIMTVDVRSFLLNTKRGHMDEGWKPLIRMDTKLIKQFLINLTSMSYPCSWGIMMTNC